MRGESMSRPEQNAAVNNGIVLLLRTTIKKIALTFHRSFYECLISLLLISARGAAGVQMLPAGSLLPLE